MNNQALQRIFSFVIAVLFLFSHNAFPVLAMVDDGGQATPQSTEENAPSNTDTEEQGGSSAQPGESAGEEDGDNAAEPQPPQDDTTGEPQEETPEDGEQSSSDGQKDKDEEPVETEKEPYSIGALEELLNNLAGEWNGDSSRLIRWVIKSDLHFTNRDRQEIFQGLTEDPARAYSFFAATQEIWEREQEANAKPTSETVNSKGLEEILEAVREFDSEGQNREEEVPDGDISIEETQLDVIPVTEILQDESLRGIMKQIQPMVDEDGNEVFRHYTITTGFDAVELEEFDAADVVLLIDNSRSMGDKLSAAKAAAARFVSRPAVRSSGSRFAVVTFSQKGETVLDLTDAADVEEILEAIGSIETENLSNLQGGILEAGRILELDDSEGDDADASDKIVLLFTDGGANLRQTDIWRYRFEWQGGNALWEYDIEQDEEPEEGVKRWSYLSGEEIYLDDQEYHVNLTTAYGTAIGSETARLEAQYLAALGADIHVVDYSGGSQRAYLESLTKSMGEIPLGFSGDITEAPYEGKSQPEKDYGGKTRVYSATDKEQMKNLSVLVLPGEKAGMTEFVIEDSIGEDFELVASDSIRVLDSDGRDITDTFDWKFKTGAGSFTWETPEDLESGAYYLMYDVRVKDDPEEPLRYFPEGDTVVPLTESLLYSDSEVYEFDLPEVEIPALMEISTEDLVVFAGEEILLEGLVARGEEGFAYRWVDEEENVLEEGVSVNGEAAAEATSPDEQTAVTLTGITEEGEHTFYLEVTDEKALAAGYSAGTLREALQVTVVGGTLTVHVLDRHGEALEGYFETTITKTTEDGAEERYHFLGGGTKVYDAGIGLGRGTYTVSTYAPYGYQVLDEAVSIEIAPRQDEDGNWISCDRIVTIIVEKTDAGYFYSLAS